MYLDAGILTVRLLIVNNMTISAPSPTQAILTSLSLKGLFTSVRKSLLIDPLNVKHTEIFNYGSWKGRGWQVHVHMCLLGFMYWTKEEPHGFTAIIILLQFLTTSEWETRSWQSNAFLILYLFKETNFWSRCWPWVWIVYKGWRNRSAQDHRLIRGVAKTWT